MTRDHIVVLVDGHCSLCKGWTHWVARRDGEDELRFASQQSGPGARVLKEHDISPDTSVVVLVGDEVYTRSRAVLEILRVLSWPWPVLYAGIVIPWFIRDTVYDFVASHRYQWFGREENDFCEVDDDLEGKRLA